MKGRKKLIIERARLIKLLVLDVDGVLTDGSITLDEDGRELKSFHVRDGHGIKMLGQAGIETAIITGRYSKVVERRAKELGISEVYQRCRQKTPAYERLLARFGLTDAETAFVGDDVVDVPLLKRAGFSVAVSDAVDEAREAAMLITKNPGGRGAVREVTDFLLKTKGLWDELIDKV